MHKSAFETKSRELFIGTSRRQASGRSPLLKRSENVLGRQRPNLNPLSTTPQIVSSIRLNGKLDKKSVSVENVLKNRSINASRTLNNSQSRHIKHVLKVPVKYFLIND